MQVRSVPPGAVRSPITQSALLSLFRAYLSHTWIVKTGERETKPTFRPWKLRAGGAIDDRRHELFALAAPVFREHGYHGATIKALAHACHLSPSGLYHYFSSKEELAIYLVRRPRMDWATTYIDPGIDPLVQLRELIDLSIQELPTYLLALQLAVEIEGKPNARDRRSSSLEGEAVFGRILMAVDPDMRRDTAAELARHLLAVLVGSAFTGLDPEEDRAVRSRMVALVRAALVPAIVDAHRFDFTMVRST